MQKKYVILCAAVNILISKLSLGLFNIRVLKRDKIYESILNTHN